MVMESDGLFFCELREKLTKTQIVCGCYDLDSQKPLDALKSPVLSYQSIHFQE